MDEARIEVKLLSYQPSKDPGKELERIRSRFEELLIQSFNPSLLLSMRQIKLLALQTLYAKRINQLLARDAGIDFLMRLANEGQINKAVSIAGAKAGERAILLVAGESSKVSKAIKFILKEIKEAKVVKVPDKAEDDQLKVSEAAVLNIDRLKAHTP